MIWQVVVTERYEFYDWELSAAPRLVAVPPDAGGVAVLLRQEGIPVGFAMKRARPGSSLALEAIFGSRFFDELRAADTLPRFGRALLPPTTVAICTRRRPAMLARCLEYLARRAGAAFEPPHQILVVDNTHGDPDTEAVAAAFRVRYVREPVRGVSAARNRAVQEVTTELVAFVDDDVVIDEGWWEGLVRAYSQWPHAGGYGGPVFPWNLDGRPQILFAQRGGLGQSCQRVLWKPASPAYPWTWPCGEACFGAGANSTFRRDALMAVGGFDYALGTGTESWGGEDLEIVYRLLRAGYDWGYEPQMAVFHDDRATMASLRRQIRGWGRGYAAYLWKYIVHRNPDRGRFAWVLARTLVRKAGGIVASALGLRRYDWPVVLAWEEFRGVLEALLGAYARARRGVEADGKAGLHVSWAAR